MRWAKLERAYRKACGANGISPNDLKKVIQNYKEIRATLNLGYGYRGNDQEWEPKAPSRTFRGNSIKNGTQFSSEIAMNAYHYQQSVCWSAFNEQPIYSDTAGNIIAPTMPGEAIEVKGLDRNGGFHPNPYLNYIEHFMSRWEKDQEREKERLIQETIARAEEAMKEK